MALYAHARIEHPTSGEFYERGDVVPDDLPGLDEIVEAGSAREEPYDPDAETQEPPQFVEIDGVRYARQESDDA